MKFKPTPAAKAVSAALLALASVHPLMAQTAASTSTTQTTEDNATSSTTVSKKDAKKEAAQLEKVVVTSSKRALPAYKLPYNVSVMTEEALKENNITDIKKLIAESESINAPGNSARFADTTTVRGLNTGAANANNIEQFVRSTLSYYLDDTPLPNIGYRIKDIARVETLIGPQGTLYGAGALGGTVRYITNQPKFGVTEGSVSTAVYQTKNGGLSNDTDAVFNVPLTADIALRGSISNLNEAGFTDRAVSRPWAPSPVWKGTPDTQKTLYEDDDWQKVKGGRVALRWKASPTVVFGLSHVQQDQVAHGTSGTQLYPTAKNPVPGAANAFVTQEVFNDHTIISPNEEYSNRNFKMDSVDLDWNLGFAKLHSSTARYSDRRQGAGDYTGAGDVFYNWIDSTLAIDSAKFNGQTASIAFDNYYEGLVHETRLSSNSDGPLSWVGGVFYNKTQRSLRFSEIVPALDATGFTPTAEGGRTANEGYRENLQSDYTETAVFGEASYKLSDRWTVTGGGRVFSYSDDGYSNIRDFTGPTSRESLATEGQSGKSYFKLNTSYEFADDLLSYLTFSQGYRRGGANGYRDYGTKKVNPEVRAYQPDSTNNIELGVKGYLFDRKLYIQTAVYQIDWVNPQVGYTQTIDDLFPINGIANGANARSRGLELAFRYRFNENWQLTYNGATTSAEFVDDKKVQLYTVASGDDANYKAGTALWGAPKWKHNAGVRYSTVLDNGVALSSTLRVRYVDALQWSENTSLLYPAYTIYNASLGLSKDNWDLSFWGSNLTDKRAVVSNNSGTGQSSRLGTRVIYATPLTVGASLSYYFK